MQDSGEFEDYSITSPSKPPTKKESKSSKLKSFLSDINFLKRKTYAGVDTHLISPPSAAADAIRRQTWAPAASDRNMSRSPINMSVLTKKSSTGPQPETSNFDSFLNKSPSNQRERSTPKISVSTSQLMQRNSFGSQPKINSSPVLEIKRSTPRLSSSTSDLLSRQSPEPQMSDFSSCLNVSPIKLARVPAHRKHSVIVSSPVKKLRSVSTPTARKSVTAEHRLSMPVKVSTINSPSPPPAPPGSPRSETLYSEPEVDTKVAKRHSSTSIERKKSSPSIARHLSVPSENKEEISSQAGSPTSRNSTSLKSTPRQRLSTPGKTTDHSSLENGIIASPLKPSSSPKNELTQNMTDISVKRHSSTSVECQVSSPTFKQRLSVPNEMEEISCETGTSADLTGGQLATETLAEISDYSTVDTDIIRLSSVTVTSPLSESLDQITEEKKLSSSSELKKSSLTMDRRLSKLDENEDNFIEGGTPISRAARRRRSSTRLSTTSPGSRSKNLI